jgi:hypothetical protein
VNLAAVASATRAGNVVRLRMTDGTTQETNIAEDADAVWAALKGWATAKPAGKVGK